MKTKQLTEENAASETNDKDHFELHILQKENVCHSYRLGFIFPCLTYSLYYYLYLNPLFQGRC